MVSNAHREEIAAVPYDVLQRIMELPEPDFRTINDALPEQYQYLAQEILDLLTYAPDTLRQEATPEPAPAPEAMTMPGPEPEPETEPAPVAAKPSFEPEPAAPAESAPRTGRAARFMEELSREQPVAKRGVNPDDILPPAALERFVPYQYGGGDVGISELRTTIAPARDDRGPLVELNWDAYSEPGATETIYRVVSTTNIDRPANPESNDQLLLTLGHDAEDIIRPTEAYREYQVWAYPGANPTDCFNRQPVLLARKLVIFPVRGLIVNASDGKISGSWESLPGHHSVRVYVTDAKLGLAPDHPGSELEVGVSDRDFRHSSPVQGVTMNVAVKPVIEHLDGKTEVGPISEVVSVTLHGNLTQTNFETIDRLETEEGTLISFVVYGPPGGNFRVYLTQEKPDKDLSWTDVELSSLPQGGLDGNFQDYGEIPHNEQFGANHLWPDGWDAVFATPVTVLGDRAWVGRTAALQRVQEATEVELREYVGFQLVTFAWPQGASMVKVERQYQGGGERTTVKDFSEEDYTKHGGIRLQLDPGGEEVVLIPQNSYAGKTTYGEETVIAYPGLRKFFYDVQVQPASYAGPGGLNVAVWAERHDDLNPPSFAALINSDRLPLAAEDLHLGGVRLRATSGESQDREDLGSNLETNHISADPRQASRWFIPAEEFATPGFFRLFVQQFHSIEDGAVRKILTDERLTHRRITEEDLRLMNEVPVQPVTNPMPAQEPEPEHERRRWFGRR